MRRICFIYILQIILISATPMSSSNVMALNYSHDLESQIRDRGDTGIILSSQMMADILRSNSRRDVCRLNHLDWTLEASALLKAAVFQVQRYAQHGKEVLAQLAQCDPDLVSLSRAAIADLEDIATTILPKYACELLQNEKNSEAQCLTDMAKQTVEPLLKLNCGGRAEKQLAYILRCSKELIVHIDDWFASHAPSMS